MLFCERFDCADLEVKLYDSLAASEQAKVKEQSEILAITLPKVARRSISLFERTS
jgi:hypothetical protein